MPAELSQFLLRFQMRWCSQTQYFELTVGLTPLTSRVMASLFEAADSDLSEFLSLEDDLFQQFGFWADGAFTTAGHGDESLPEEGCGENKRKFCPSSSTGAGLGLSKRSAKRARKANETVTKLPDEVRTSQFAEFMLGERFKFVPESDLKAAELKLYSFPRFSRCDALSYFPSTFASFINSGDMASISNLFDSFFHRSCNVTVTQSANTIPYTQYLSLVRMFNDLHPDVIMCMHSTKEVDNEIRSKLYFKFTENKIIYESVARTNKDPTVAPYLVPSRAEHLKRKFGLPPSTAEEEQQYRALLDSEDDVEVYACIDFRLCFNKHSKKVMQLKLLVDVTSLHRVDSCY